MRGVDQGLGDIAIDPRQADVEASPDEVLAADAAQIHFSIDGRIGRDADLHGGGGAIVNISSAGGMMAYPNTAAYVASKWGARGLTKTAALELGRDNIRVNSVHPGGIRTPMTAGPEAAAAIAAEVRRFAIARVAEPDEITRLVLYVASHEASFSTGSEFIADGGHLLGPVPEGDGT